MPRGGWIVFFLMPALISLSLGSASAQLDPVPIDCEGPAPDAEPGTAEFAERDAINMYCAEQRHLDQAQHPSAVLPAGNPANDAYREPSRHDDMRFRYDATTIEGLQVEVYRPCAQGTCTDRPEGLETFEPPYPAVISFHGGLSRKELHWWSSQSLAEAGYLVISYTSEGTSPTIEEAESLMAWLFERSDPSVVDFDGERVGIAGHSAGGVLVSSLGQTDARVDAIVSWDRAQSTPLPDDIALRTPTLFMFADYNCQRVPVCQPQPYTEPPGPDGPGDKGKDFMLVRDAGIDTMQIALRAATHLDWVGGDLQGNRYAELVSVYYTLAWFDRYLKGADDPGIASQAYERLAATAFDDSADRHNISQGLWDLARAATSGDPPFGGNVPYAIENMPVADRLSFYYLSKCYLTVPGSSQRAVSDDLRVNGCGAEPEGGAASHRPGPGLRS